MALLMSSDNTPHWCSVPRGFRQVDYRFLCGAVNPIFHNFAAAGLAWTDLEKRMIIAYLSWRAGTRRMLAWRELDLLRAAKAMKVQEFELVPGALRVAGSFAKAADQARHAAAAMTHEDDSELRAQLAQLRQEHRDLDAAIEALHNSPGADLLQVQRLKKRKLHLRDRIIQIEDQLTPDIIA